MSTQGEVQPASSEGERAPHVLAYPPRRYSECRARGLGTSVPCPWARCRHSLLVELAPSTPGRLKVRQLIDLSDDSDELFERPTCLLALVASGEQIEPVRIAELMKVSLGLAELIQRLALAKVGPALVRVRDEQRHVEMDIAGLPDGRR